MIHFHCLDGCEKAVGIESETGVVCIRCGAPFLECSPEICREIQGLNASQDHEPPAGDAREEARAT